MERVNIVWRRLGKEHGEKQGIRKNDNSTIQRHLQEQLERKRAHPLEDWRWWKVSDDVLVELPLLGYGYCDRSIIYNLPSLNACAVEDFRSSRPLGCYYYYIHIGKTAFDPQYGCWIFTDWFVDILVSKDGKYHTVLDLDDLAEANEKGIISTEEMREILRSSARMLRLIEGGEFPLESMRAAKEAVFGERVSAHSDIIVES